MAHIDTEHYANQAALEDYSSGGCLPFFALPPLAVVVVGLIMALVLSRINISTSLASEIEEQNSFEIEIEDHKSFIAPYDEFTITQGVHGSSYGHLAIDIAAGKGSEIRSPINGMVTKKYTDVYGNPTLVIENEIYRVMMLHGKYSVSKGEKLIIGQVVGTESNLGYTTDMQGRPCQGRNCGYHTHLNVFDKILGANVNPLDLINHQ
ncbi:MAG: M23 family metallopeptidase [Anaerolineales bacterium]|nr:M23 family metallopeptidase [Chloroflexota bacterium]MBL6981249.1 M23 family metallopeptidase [Anaerolineales bacterium]